MEEIKGTVSWALRDAKGMVEKSGSEQVSVPALSSVWLEKLEFKVEGDEITVKSHGFAKSVEISNENDDLRLSDNFFDINTGEATVKVLKVCTDRIKVRSVYDIASDSH